jgi:hypothetical protein
MKLKIIEASYHRNGIEGMGFYAILFNDKENGKMLAHLFDEEGYCAVTKVKELSKDNIAFACGNSWRGDVFEASLRPLLNKYLEKQGTK